jgi:L,D-peptidoglycan transpeptidase YkuD (ErfK/YbiS/YcfS/YnhG family)
MLELRTARKTGENEPRMNRGGGGVAHLVVGRWGARFRGRRFPCAVGRGGIGAKRREGDGVTPACRHRIEAVLHRPGRTRSPWRGGGRIRPGDGWSEEPADPACNRPVRRPRPGAHETMFRADPLYDLVVVLDWNRDPVVPGRGSAIVL